MTVDHSLFPSMFIGGSFNKWNPASMPMQYQGNGKWKSTRVNLLAGQHEFKFISLKNRTGVEWGNAAGTMGTAGIISNDTIGINFTLSENGEYIICFNESTLNYSILKAPKYDYLSIVGDATPADWTPSGIALIQDSTNLNIFSYKGQLKEGNFKFHAVNGDWCDGDWLLATTQDQTLTSTGYTVLTGCPSDSQDLKWKLLTDGSYSITVDLEKQTISIKSLDYFPVVFLIGSATDGAWDLSNTSDMTTDTFNSSILNWSGKLSPGEFKIGTTKTWSNGWPWIHPKTSGQNLILTDFEVLNMGFGSDNKWVIDNANEGYYNIKIDLANNKIHFLKSSETGVKSNYTQNIKVYPNPITGILNIDIDDTFNAMVGIYSLTGVKLFQSSLKNRHNSVSFKKEIKQGEYLVKITTSNQSKSFKIIKTIN